jgi:hypothetical protein
MMCAPRSLRKRRAGNAVKQQQDSQGADEATPFQFGSPPVKWWLQHGILHRQINRHLQRRTFVVVTALSCKSASSEYQVEDASETPLCFVPLLAVAYRLRRADRYTYADGRWLRSRPQAPMLPINRSVTSFGDGLRCMDIFLVQYGTHASLMVEDLNDKTQKSPAHGRPRCSSGPYRR